MPQDKNGTELKTGDVVTMEFVVKYVYLGVEYSNITLESVESLYPGETKTMLTSVNTKQVTKKPTNPS